MITNTMLENANKVGFLIEQYPEHSLAQIISLLGMPPIDINAACWAAMELGFITEPDEQTKKCELLPGKPDAWQCGKTVEDLKEMLVFCFQKLATKEEDMDEVYLSNWTQGHESHDVLIALKQLTNERVLATYELTDPKDLKSTYTFYTLYENSEQMWGRKAFKEQPTGAEKPDKDTK